MSSLSVRSPMGPRAARSLLLVAALAAAAGCAEGDAIENPSSTSSGPGGGDDGAGGDGGQLPATTGTDAGSTTTTTTSTSTSSTTTTSSAGGEGGGTSSGGGEGGGTASGGGEGGLGGGSSTGGGEGGQGGAEPTCGDGARNGAEACDGADLGGATCTTIGQRFIGGTLGCTAACVFDTTACQAPPECGDGVIEGTEQCDGANLGSATCQSRGFQDGTLACAAGCTFDETDCSTCGDGVIENAEVCDGANLGGATCTGLGHTGGSLSCGATCALVETACTDCGDGVIEGAEACDGGNFNGATCASMGFSGGTLTCSNACAIGTGSCWTCGDGVVQPGQSCPVCSDDTDNDGDGYRDLADLGCQNAADGNENIYRDNCNGVGGPIYDVSLADNSLDVIVSGNNAGFPDATDAPCQSNTGPEVVAVYRNVAFESDIIITTDFLEGITAFDSVLTVRRGSCNNPTATCDDDGGAGTLSTVQIFNVQPGELLFITLEGYNGATGPFNFLIDLEGNDF